MGKWMAGPGASHHTVRTSHSGLCCSLIALYKSHHCMTDDSTWEDPETA